MSKIPDVPRVAVIMPVYNSERFLKESIWTVLEQTFRDWELIAIDDGSTDQSGAILEDFQRDRRVRLIRLKRNQGTATARNAGVESSDCEYLAFLDADDLADPRRLEVQVECMDSRPSLAITASRAMVLRDGTIFKPPASGLRPDDIGPTLLFRNCIVHSSVMTRRICWEPYRSEFEPAEDYDLWVRLALNHRFFLLREPLVTYRDHPSDVSNRLPEKMEAAVKKIHRFQLERLGVAPNGEIHYRLSAWPAGSTPADLRDAEGWLQELEAKNSVYEPESLRRAIERVWFSICLDSWSLGPRAFQIYQRSCLRRMSPSRLWQFVCRFGREALFG
jgi:glycosyltransferase involved in cell wall biosynthesis